MTKIYLIRHAEAEGNVFRRMHGQYDSMITPNGMHQIAALEKRFETIPVDAVYASDLTRTCVTAGAIYKPKKLPLHRDARFREVNVGAWEDVPFGAIEREDGARMHDFSHHPYRWSIEGGETLPMYAGRFIEAMNEVAVKHDGQTVAIFAHGMVLRGTLLQLFFSPEQTDAVGHCENTGVTHLTWDNGEYRLVYMNDASHLEAEISTLGRQHWWRNHREQDYNMWFRTMRNEDAVLLQTLHCPQPAPDDCVYIAMLSDAAVGVVHLRARDAETGGIVFLGLLPEQRGIGLGAQLVGCAVSHFRKAGAQWLELLTQEQSNGAKALFLRYGFANVPQRLYLVPTTV